MMTFILALGIAAFQLAETGVRPDPCALLSRADATIAVGSAITRLETTSAGSGTTCSYEIGRPGHSVVFTVFQTSSRDEAALTFDQDVRANARLYVQPVVAIPHLGDAAKAFGHVLWVRRGTFVFVINVVDASVRGTTLLRAQALARKAITRIDASAR